MSGPRPTPSRLVEVAAALATIAIPIVLIARTYEPLESPPRASRASSVEETPAREGAISAQDENAGDDDRRGRRSRRARNQEQEQDQGQEQIRDQGGPPAAATPRP